MLPHLHASSQLNCQYFKRSRCVCRSIEPQSLPVSTIRPVEPAKFSSVLGMVQWAIANKIRFTGCRPDIRDGIRGVFATADCNAGDNLVAVPLASSLVVRPGERSPFPDFIPQAVWEALPWYGQLACKLLHEKSLGPASRFADYLPVLPQTVDLPALWPEEQVRRLQYPYLERQILDEQNEWLRLYDTVRRHLDRRGLSRGDFLWALACVRSRTFAGPHFPTPPAVKLLAGAAAAAAVTAARAAVGGGIDSAAADVDAAVAVATAVLPGALAALGVPLAWQAAEARRAETGETGTVLYAVCPFIDMFNHDSRRQSECVFESWRDEFRVAAGEPYRRGQQVLISYGNQSNDALLQRYGFVQMDGNPYDRYVLRDMEDRVARVLQRELGVPREEVRAAARRLGLPAGALQEVVLTSASGAPQQTLQAIGDLLAAVVATHRTSALPGTRLTSSAQAVVGSACAAEAEAAGTSLEEDEAALVQLEDWEDWEAAAAEAEVRGAVAGSSVPEPDPDVASSAGLADALVDAEEHGHAGEGHQGGADAHESALGEGPVAKSERRTEAEAVRVTAPPELAAFDGDVERYRTVLLFRIAKKRVLQALAAMG